MVVRAAMRAALLLLSLAATFSNAIAVRVPRPVPSLYIVRLRSAAPIATYSGGFAGFPATAAPAFSASASPSSLASAPRRRRRIDFRAPHVRAFAELLARQQRKVAADVGLSLRDVIYNFQHVSNGFAASLTPLQARVMRRHVDVADVSPSLRVSHYTSASPAFLQLNESLWMGAGGQGSAGEGVVVGIVDTGIWPEHKSFANDSTFLYGPPPATWLGSCSRTRDFPVCNGKLVGAAWFRAGFRRQAGGRADLSGDWLSARDSDGHGTWCAGAAAGNGPVSTASVGSISGVAPRARIAAYKVFWKSGGALSATMADVFAAVNRAVADGVDVLSLSLGSADPYATYFDHLPSLNALAAGVVVTYAAGNAAAPLRSGDRYRTVDNFAPWYLTVGASSISRVAVMNAPVQARANNTSTQGPSSISPLNTIDEAPVVARFSSSGPLVSPSQFASPPGPTNDILKPDIIGPGVSLWAATRGRSPSGTVSLFSRLSGTSMATPHLAGIAALIIQRNPSWSPSQVMSAIMTTATVRNSKGGPIGNAKGAVATPWEMGSGHVNPVRLLDPGLTFNTDVTEFRNFLAGQSLSRAKKEFRTASLQAFKAYNLNRPIICVSRLRGMLRLRRRLTNVASESSTYSAVVSKPRGVNVTVSPASFTIAPGETVSVLVTVTAKRSSVAFAHGSIVWGDEMGHSVRSVLAVQPLKQ